MYSITTKLFVLFSFVFLVSTNCQKPKEKTLADQLVDFSAISFIGTQFRCGINSSNNPSFFQTGTVPNGGAVSVKRIDSNLQEAGSVEIYYPDNAATNLPVVVLMPGGNVHSSFYSGYAARVASAGYVVYVPNRCTTFFTQYFLKVSSASANEIYSHSKLQNTDNTSTLFGRLNPESMAYLGHSLGGVVSLYSVNGLCEFPFCDAGTSFLTQIKVAIVYGSGLKQQVEKSKFKVDASGKGIPVGYLSGSLDGAFKPTEVQESYDYYTSPKYLVKLEGANHYSITDTSAPFGANAESSNATLSQEVGIQRISEVTLLFLNGYLKGNGAALTNLQTNNTGITGVTVESSL